MSRVFSIPSVLRSTPNALLEGLFGTMGHQPDPGWTRLKEHEIEPMRELLGRVPAGVRDEIESVLRSAFELACDSGFQALLAAAPSCGMSDLASLVPDGLSLQGRAMWTWIHHRAVFERGILLHQTEELPWWRKRSDVPKGVMDRSAHAIARLQEAISTLLKSQGRGERCTVEHLSRGGVDYFFAHPDDFARTVTIHDPHGRLSPEVLRQTMLIAFAYDRVEGTLETCAKLPKALKEGLEAAFARVILRQELSSHQAETVYTLDHLLSPTFELTTEPVDRLRAWIRRLRLFAMNSGRRLTIEVDEGDDIHAAVEDFVGTRCGRSSPWNVERATLCFEFQARDGQRPGRQSVDIACPHSSNLRNARPERAALIQKYLSLWEIERVLPPATNSLALGA